MKVPLAGVVSGLIHTGVSKHFCPLSNDCFTKFVPAAIKVSLWFRLVTKVHDVSESVGTEELYAASRGVFYTPVL